MRHFDLHNRELTRNILAKTIFARKENEFYIAAFENHSALEFEVNMSLISAVILLTKNLNCTIMNRHPLTFIEKITAQIKEEQRRYRNALSSGKEFFELQQIKSTIHKLEATLQQLMNNLHQYVPKNTSPLTEA